MSVLALIPARAGSKGIHRKNIRELNGKPLIAWSIEAALKAESVDTIIVSTDDEEIAEVAISYGVEVPFLRPFELAQDDTPIMDVVFHTLEQLPSTEFVLQLNPTSPLRTAEDIDGIIEFLQENKCSSVVSVCETSKHPNWMYYLEKDGLLTPYEKGPLAYRRQELPKIYALNGSLFLANTQWLLHTKNFISSETQGYVMPTERSADIDTPLDWEWVEFLIKKRYPQNIYF
jgi:CMP-N,N'-diacetyllegionaminic acid synthase